MAIFSTVIFFVGIAVILLGFLWLLMGVKKGEAGAGFIGLVITFIIGLVCIVSTTVGSVDAKKVGVVTSMKKPTGEVKGAGAYWTAPWKNVTEMDAAAQTATYDVTVQLAGGATAVVTIYPNWNMNESAAPQLFQDYKSFDAVVDSLFKQQLVSTANNVFGSYNPLTNVDPKTGQLKKSKVEWANELKAALEANPLIKDKLTINSLSIPTIAPDKNTQDNLNAIIAEFARGTKLDQEKINADKQKAITETNAKVDKATRCLEIAEKSGGNPGTCALFEKGNGSGVILNAGSNK